MTNSAEVKELSLREVMRFSVDGIFAFDRNRCIVLFSEGCERLTGRDSASVLNTSCACHELTQCRDEQGRPLSGALCPALKIFDGDIASARQRMSLQHRDGREVWVETTYSPVFNDEGTVTHVVGVMRDITQARRQEQDLKEVLYRLGGAHSPGAAQRTETVTPIAEGFADASGVLDRMLGTIERKEILGALDRASGQRTLAAKLLGISRSRLYRRMEALGIDPRSAASR